MFEVSRSVSANSYSSFELFEMALEAAPALASRWELEAVKIDAKEGALEVGIVSTRFKGKLQVRGKELMIEGVFNDLFPFGKKEVEEELGFWIQDLFQTTYDM